MENRFPFLGGTCYQAGVPFQTFLSINKHRYLYTLVYLCTNVNTCAVNYKLALAMHLCKDEIMCCCSCWPSHPGKGVQGGEQKRGTLCSGRTWQNRSSDSWIFSGADFFWAHFLYLLISRKALKPSWWLFLVTSRNLLEEYALDSMYSPFTKITAKLTSPSPHLSEAVSQNSLRCCLLGDSPHFAPNKT